MKKYILLLIIFLGISIEGYSQGVLENLGVIDSNEYYYSNSYLESTQTYFVFHFKVSGTRKVHFDFCSSKGLSGTRVSLFDYTTGRETEITERCEENQLVSAADNLNGIYDLKVNIVSAQRKWDLSINVYSTIDVVSRTDKPINLGTLYSNMDGWYIENNTEKFLPDKGAGGALRYKLHILCPTLINYSTDAGHIIVRDTNGKVVEDINSGGNYGMGGQMTLNKGTYIMSLDYNDGHEDNLVIEFYTTLLEDIKLGVDSLRTSFARMKTPLTRLPGNHNYILSRTMLSKDETQFKDEVTFFDGLGRTSIVAQKGITPLGKNLLVRQQFDGNGREWKQWLPVPSADLYPQLSKWEDFADSIYGGDKRPYIENIYKNDGSDRIQKVFGSGEAWKEHPQQVEFFTNTADGTMLQCSYYYIDNYGDLRNYNILPAGQLQVRKDIDEDGKFKLTFIDKQGHTVLERQVNKGVNSNTYYVYDGDGNLRYVFPPEYTLIASSNVTQYAYCYSYDERNRCIEKKIPGCQPVKYVYDDMDRLIFKQDGNMATKHEWLFSLYDKLGRQTIEGICKSDTVPVLKGRCVFTTPSSQVNGGLSNTGYVAENFVYIPTKVLKVNYYDNYRFIIHEELEFAFPNRVSPNMYDSLYIHKPNILLSAKGRLTGKMINTATNTDAKWLQTKVYYYDQKGRIVQCKDNDNSDNECYAYSYSGNVLRKIMSHLSSSVNEYFTYEYDLGERLKKTIHRCDNNLPVILSENLYDELGRLKEKKYHDGIMSTNYEYDVNGSIKGIVNPFFQQKLYYNNGIGRSYYNGNISSMTWRTDSITHGYNFNYDDLNRMADAIYGEGSDLSMNINMFSERVVKYDKQGDIEKLERYGRTGANTYGLIDDLVLNYNSCKQLTKVTDNFKGIAFNGGLEFKDGANQSVEYIYDSNGNLIKDLNKNISNIEYDYLNLPTLVQFPELRKVYNQYDAEGTKKFLAYEDADRTFVDFNYKNNAIYKEGLLSKLLTEEGYITFDYGIMYHYFVKDHQGNNRVIVNQDGVIEETNHYYPFGGTFANSTVQLYKYNGKEFNNFHGLNWYDYGARWYDPALGRWHVVDPLGDRDNSISPYAYCGNNPINRIDPDGKQGIVIPTPTPTPFPLYYPVSNSNSYRYPTTMEIKNSINNGINSLKGSIENTYNFLKGYTLIGIYQAKEAVSPEYEHQRSRDRRNKEDLDKNQANIAKSIDTNISGMMPNGDPAPKRNPKDGGKKTISGIAIGVIGAGTKVVLDATNPDPSQDSYDIHTKKIEKEEIYNPTIWEEYFDWKIKF